MRIQITEDDITQVDIQVMVEMYKQLKRKGWGAFASPHEMWGVVEEEVMEVNEAMDDIKHSVRANNLLALRKELIQVAVAAMFGIASLDKCTKDT